MRSEKSTCDKDKEIELVLLESIWKRIRAHLEIERQRTYDEIKNYPRPIPACDLQFNHLLEKRAGICQELDRMQSERLRAGRALDLLAQFIRSSNFIDTETKEQIKSALEEGVTELEPKLAGR